MTIPDMEQHIQRLEKKCKEQKREIEDLKARLLFTEMNPEAITLPTQRMAPLKIASVETHDSPDGMIFVYVIERDRMQEYAKNKKWHEDNDLPTDHHNCRQTHPEMTPQWVAMDSIRMATQTPLNVGVGEHYTLDLIPFQPLSVPEQEQPSLADFLRRLMGE